MKPLTKDESKFLVRFNLACIPVIYKIMTDLPVAETSDALIAKGLFFGACVLAPSVFALSLICIIRLIGFILTSVIVKAANVYYDYKYNKAKKPAVVETTPISGQACEVIEFPKQKVIR